MAADVKADMELAALPWELAVLLHELATLPLKLGCDVVALLRELSCKLAVLPQQQVALQQD